MYPGFERCLLRLPPIFGGLYGIGLGRQVTEVGTTGDACCTCCDGWILRHLVTTHGCNVCARLQRSNCFRRGDSIDFAGGVTQRTF